MTATGDNTLFVKDLGADIVIDYRSEQFDQMIRNHDAVLDTVGGETYKRSFGVVHKGGVLVSMLEEPDRDLMRQHEVTAMYQYTITSRQRLERVSELIDSGALRVYLEKTFPLERAVEAFEYFEQSHTRGKVVLAVRT